MYGRVFGVGEFKYAIYNFNNFKGVKSVAMATKFRQKLPKIAQISILRKKSRNILIRMYNGAYGVCEFKYAM